MKVTRLLAAAVLCAGVSSAAFALPKLIITPVGDDLASTGNGVSGAIYDGSLNEYVPLTWSRTAGSTRINGAFVEASSVYCSSDLAALAMGAANTSDWGDLNCFNGYYWRQEDADAGHVLGTPRPAPSPCWVPAITHRWTAGAGWVNAGSTTRSLDGTTGRYYGATRCDGDINLPKGISDNGRYVLMNGWRAPLVTPTGGPAFGLCGDFVPMVYDSQTGSVSVLAMQPGSTTARADRINADGSVITGHDLDSANSTRRTCVWRNGVQTIIDPFLGAKDNAGVNGPGTFIASGASTQFVANTFGQSGVRLVRWSWNGSTWTPQNLGRPAAYLDPVLFIPIPFSDLWVTGVSDDGNTIVGTALYGAAPPSTDGIFRPFIWRPTINGGVPMDLEAYVASIDSPTSPIFSSGFQVSSVTGLSADGNALLISVFDQRNTCTPPNKSLVTFHSGVLYLDGSGIANLPPQIALDPKDWTESHNYNFGSALNVFAGGSWPLSFQWQREDPSSPGMWLTLDDSCSGTPTTPFPSDNSWNYEGVHTRQIRVNQAEGGGGRSGRYRVVVSNPYGSVTSEAATLTHQSGACCAFGSCFIAYASECNDPEFHYYYVGDGSTCEASPCDSRACCVDGSCVFTTPDDCVSWQGGELQAIGSTCDSNPCAPACPADFDHSGDVSVGDLFGYLDAWFAEFGAFGNGLAADFDVSGDVSVADLFAYLDAWFATFGQTC
jgi:hypothetical protein